MSERANVGPGWRIAAALAILAAAAGAALAVWRDSAREARPMPTVLVEEQAGFRYEYHVPSGGETLYDLARDPDRLVNVMSAYPEQAAACRRELTRRLGVADLEELRRPHAETIRKRRALGYL